MENKKLKKTKYWVWEWERFIKLLEKTIEQLENYQEKEKGEFKEIILKHFDESLILAKKELKKEKKNWKQFEYFLNIISNAFLEYHEKNKKKIKKH